MRDKNKLLDSASVLAGLGAGLAIMLLLAPRSGRETRRLIRKRANALVDRGKRFVDCGPGLETAKRVFHAAVDGETVIETT